MCQRECKCEELATKKFTHRTFVISGAWYAPGGFCTCSASIIVVATSSSFLELYPEVGVGVKCNHR